MIIAGAHPYLMIWRFIHLILYHIHSHYPLTKKYKFGHISPVLHPAHVTIILNIHIILIPMQPLTGHDIITPDDIFYMDLAQRLRSN